MNMPGAGPPDDIAALIFRLDAQRIIRWVNEAAAAALGHSAPDLAGIGFDEIASVDAHGVHVFRTAAGPPLATLVAESPPDAAGCVSITAIPVPPAADVAQDAKLAALGELAHHVVHELNQPLSVIRMAIGTARRKLSAGGELDADFIDAKLQRIDNQCVRAAAIVESMRVFVPRNHSVRVALDVNRAVDNAVGMTAPKFRKLNAEVTTKFGEPRRVIGNEMHIEPALLCVLGEIHDRVAAARHERPAAVEVRTAPIRDDTVEIVFTDAAGRPRGPVAATTGIALGMGLALARELVGEMGGRLDIEPGESGMIYRFSLPVARDERD